jgi:hypothetical protein
MAFYRLEPFGAEADDQRLAQLLALIANVNRDTKRRKLPWTPEDFLPRRVPRPPAHVDDLRPRIDAAMSAFGGTIGSHRARSARATDGGTT